jgi:glycosyltransferase
MIIDRNTNFFQITDNFAKTAAIPFIEIVKSKIDFVPTVTIAIPTFRRAALLKEALDSAISQNDFNDYDILIVDNNPERNCETEKLINSYKNKRLSYYKNTENIGMFGNWNRCIQLSSGEYISILNDDDLLHPSYLETVMNIIRSGNHNGLFVRFTTFKDNFTPAYEKYSDISKEKVTFIDNLYENTNAGSLGVIVKRNNLIELGGFNELFYPTSDYVLWVNYIKKYGPVYKINEELAYYRLSVNESLNINLHSEFIKNDLILLDQMIDQMHPFYKKIAKLAKPVLIYGKYLGMCNFSSEFGTKNTNEINIIKNQQNLINKVFYILLGFLNKTNKI